jgi:hypothetical protein
VSVEPFRATPGTIVMFNGVPHLVENVEVKVTMQRIESLAKEIQTCVMDPSATIEPRRPVFQFVYGFLGIPGALDEITPMVPQ